MNVYYADGAVQIVHGDSRDVLPMLLVTGVQADLILMDPPYGVDYVTNHRRNGDPLTSPIQGDGDLNALRDVMSLCTELLRPDGLAYVFASWKRIGDTIDCVEPYLKVRNVLIWDKGEAGTAGDLEGGYGVNFEAIIFAAKGRRFLNGRPRTIIRHDWSGARDPVHPTVKPVGLMSRLIQHATEPKDLVIDPFMGSGPVLRAAKDLGREAIGIEMEERYCAAAARRLAQEVLVFE